MRKTVLNLIILAALAAFAFSGCGKREPRGYHKFKLNVPEAAQERFKTNHATITPAVIKAVIKVESNGRPRAVSHKGAIGLMQIMPATGRMMGYTRKQLFDPETNIEAGTKYLSMMLDQFGTLERALVAYNCGPGRNTKTCRIYARKVLRLAQGR